MTIKYEATIIIPMDTDQMPVFKNSNIELGVNFKVTDLVIEDLEIISLNLYGIQCDCKRMQDHFKNILLNNYSHLLYRNGNRKKVA